MMTMQQASRRAPAMQLDVSGMAINDIGASLGTQHSLLLTASRQASGSLLSHWRCQPGCRPLQLGSGLAAEALWAVEGSMSQHVHDAAEAAELAP